jgi:hypothetical protein
LIKSKFKLKAILIPILITALTTVSINIISENLPIKIEKIRWIDLYMSVLFLILWIWLVFGELRTQMIQVTIQKSEVEKRNYLGFRRKYDFRNFDGFQTSIISSKSGRFEYLYFIKDDKKIIKISEAYHKNYFDLKENISTHLKDLGEIQFSYLDEFKEVFK